MKELAKNPDLAITAVEGDNMIYMQYDAINRSGNKALSDVRVRKALTMAIDRDELIKHLAAGGSAAKRLDAMCFTSMQACDVPPVPPYKFDPAQAKKLLAEAGFASGLEVELISRNPSKDAAIGIAGYWNAVGVKTSVQLLTITTLDKGQSVTLYIVARADWDLVVPATIDNYGEITASDLRGSMKLDWNCVPRG